MASGTIYLSTDGVLTGKIDWSSTSNGSVANTSTLYATMYARRTDGYTTYGRGWGGYLYVDGITTDVYFTDTQYVGSDWAWMASTSKTIQHNSDGTASVYIEGAVQGASGTSLANRYVFGNGTVALDTIPRASTITKIEQVEDGNNITIKAVYDKKYSGFTHDIRYIYNNKTYTPTTKSDNNGNYSFSVDYDKIVDSFPIDNSSITITVRLLTYSGTTQIGYSDKSTIISLPPSIYAPELTNVEVIDPNEKIVERFGKLIQSKSFLNITPTTDLKFNATLKGYTYLIVNNETKNTADATYESQPIEQITDGKVQVEVKAIDSRGLQSETWQTELDALLYGNPVISGFSAERDEQTPSTIDVLVDCSVYSLETHNDKRAIIKYQRQDTEQTLTKDISNLFTLVDDKYVINEIVSIPDCDEDTKYNITLEVYDFFNTYPIATTPFIVPTAFSLINYNIAGDGLAFGKIADNHLSHTIEIADNMTMLYHGVEVGTGGGGDTTPIGTISAYSGTTEPTGWLICDGRAIDRETYKELFQKIGTTYGSGNGTSTFNIPNLKGRTIVGYDSSQTEFNALAKTGGSKDLQKHSHIIDYKGGTGSTSTWGLQVVNQSNMGSYSTGETGTGTSGNLQPYIIENYIIKAINLTEKTELTSLDTIPYGSIVDYDGDEVPNGYEEVQKIPSFTETQLINSEASTSSNTTITLKGKLSDYDFIIIACRGDWNNVIEMVVPKSRITYNHVFNCWATSSYWCSGYVSRVSDTQLKLVYQGGSGWGSISLNSVIGIKFN